MSMEIGKSISNLTADWVHYSISVMVNDSTHNTVDSPTSKLVGDSIYDPVYDSVSTINDSTL